MKRSNSLAVLKGFLFLQRLDFHINFNDCSIHIARCRGVQILHFFAELLMMYTCSAAQPLAKHRFLNWTLLCNLQGKWLCNSIASTLSVNYISRCPFTTYPLNDLSQIIWCLGFTSMKFSVAFTALATLVGCSVIELDGSWKVHSTPHEWMPPN